MAQRIVLILNQTVSQVQEIQAGDSYLLPADTEVDGNFTVTGTINGQSIAAMAALLATASQPGDALSTFVNDLYTDSDDIVEGASNLFLLATERTKLGFLTITGAVDLDALKASQDAERTITTGITANPGGGYASAVELVSRFNVIATVATTGDSVRLPTAVAGLRRTIRNNGANAADVFPNAGDNINSTGVDTAISLAAGSSITLFAADSTNWYSE